MGHLFRQFRLLQCTLMLQAEVCVTRFGSLETLPKASKLVLNLLLQDAKTLHQSIESSETSKPIKAKQSNHM